MVKGCVYYAISDIRCRTGLSLKTLCRHTPPSQSVQTFATPSSCCTTRTALATPRASPTNYAARSTREYRLPPLRPLPRLPPPTLPLQRSLRDPHRRRGWRLLQSLSPQTPPLPHRHHHASATAPPGQTVVREQSASVAGATTVIPGQVGLGRRKSGIGTRAVRHHGGSRPRRGRARRNRTEQSRRGRGRRPITSVRGRCSGGCVCLGAHCVCS